MQGLTTLSYKEEPQSQLGVEGEKLARVFQSILQQSRLFLPKLYPLLARRGLFDAKPLINNKRLEPLKSS